MMGTRFLATREARAHPLYKQKLLKSTEESTVRTILFGHGWPQAPHRTLRTEFVKRWLGNEARGQESRPDEPAVGRTKIGGQEMPGLRFMGFPPNADAGGEIESMNLLAGQSVGLVQEILPASELIRKIMEEADGIIFRWVDSSSGKAVRLAPARASTQNV